MRWMCCRRVLSVLLFLFILPCTAWAVDEVPTEPVGEVDLASLALEDLLNVEVTSASKKSEKLFETASAAYVISQEDIRRSGVNSIAEALRMAPGLHVAHIDANKWAVSARGFSERYSNKLLVMVDGQSIYSPMFSGVYWDVADLPLSEIDRIEVIRGPGATMWGANAVNGIINIITVPASSSPGLQLTSFAGGEERVGGEMSFSESLGERGNYRFYARKLDRTAFDYAAGFGVGTAADDWEQSRIGLRADWTTSRGDNLSLIAGTYDGINGQSFIVPDPNNLPFGQMIEDTAKVAGTDLFLRWTRPGARGSESSLQFSYQDTDRSDAQHAEDRKTFDLDFHRLTPLGSRRQLMWGLGCRLTSDKFTDTALVDFTPNESTDTLISGFVQDEISLTPDKFRLVLGSKFEHNDYTGYEVQPSIRLLWTPTQQQTAWAAVSRAVRTPSRMERGASAAMMGWLDGYGWIYATNISGNLDFQSEELTAYEVGYRVQPRDNLSLDAALYYNDYSKLRTLELTGTEIPTSSVLANNMEGESHGVELAANWRASDRWRMAAAWSWMASEMRLLPGSTDMSSINLADETYPSEMFSLRSYYDFGRGWQFDSSLYYVSDTRMFGVPQPDIPSYWRLDLRLGCQPKQNMEVSIGARNLLAGRHREFGMSVNEVTTQVSPTVFGKITWQY